MIYFVLCHLGFRRMLIINSSENIKTLVLKVRLMTEYITRIYLCGAKSSPAGFDTASIGLRYLWAKLLSFEWTRSISRSCKTLDWNSLNCANAIINIMGGKRNLLCNRYYLRSAWLDSSQIFTKDSRHSDAYILILTTTGTSDSYFWRCTRFTNWIIYFGSPCIDHLYF